MQKTPTIKTEDRYLGSLFGLAAGDALGAQHEFRERDKYTITDMPTEELRQGLPPLHFTDDTSMALCLADSLINCQGFKPADQMYRYFRWYDDGFMSPLGYAYGVGRTVHSAMQRFIDTAEPFSGSTDPATAGNGSIMRLAPVPMLYRKLPEQAIHYAGESSRTTHGAEDAVAGCKLFAQYLLAALDGRTKAEILAAGHSVDGLSDPIRAIALGSYEQMEREQVKSSGYVVDTLEAALWAFAHSDSFAEGALLAVNLGGDTDTIAAVYGQLAGAHYGLGGIPAHWHEEIVMYDIIHDTATELYKLSEVIPRTQISSVT